MADYQYEGKPRNLLRWLLALWRVMRDPTNIDEVVIVQVGFARSRLLKRFARWEELAQELSRNEDTAAVVAARTPFGPVDLDELGALPEGTLGRSFFEHCQRQGLNPNLIRLPRETPGEFVMAHMYDTHDVWHVVTGWGTDDSGEVGLGGFYMAQMEVRLIAFVFVLLLLNSLFRNPKTLRSRLEAFAAGYGMGQKAEPLFAARWNELWQVPLPELRRRFRIDTATVTGEGVSLAA